MQAELSRLSSGGGFLFCEFISKELFIKSCCKSQFPHKLVNLSFVVTNIKNKLRDLCGKRILQIDFINAFCEIRI